MILTNFHTHSSFCDGKGKPEEYVKAAVDKGFSALGFSAHAPLPRPSDWTLQQHQIPEYITEINRLKETYRDTIALYCGLEVDYIPNKMGPADKSITDLDPDYVIGSVHTWEDPETGTYYGIDGPVDEFERVFHGIYDGNMKRLVKNYYKRIRELLINHRPDVLGHFDLVKLRNKGDRYYSESDDWYREEVMQTVEELAAAGSIVEVNTGGISRGKVDSFYPSDWIIEVCHRRAVPITVSSDAHRPQDVDGSFEDARQTILSIGYSEISILTEEGWTATTL